MKDMSDFYKISLKLRKYFLLLDSYNRDYDFITNRDQKIGYIIDHMMDVKYDVLNGFLDAYFNETEEKLPEIKDMQDPRLVEELFW